MSHRHRSIGDTLTRGVAALTVASLAALAAYISYTHMLALAHRHGHRGLDAHAFPITVDGLEVIGALVLFADRRTGRPSGRLPWVVLAIGAAASIVANLAVGPPNIVARLISGWVPISLILAVKMLAHLFEPTPPAATAAHPTTTAAQDATTPAVANRDGRPVDKPENPAPPVGLRLPTKPDTLRRWQSIWAATRHLDTANEATAAEHGISLRTLQFIRAAGDLGHLEPPATADEPDPPAPIPDRAPSRNGATAITS